MCRKYPLSASGKHIVIGVIDLSAIRSGVQLHLTSLPGGRLGREAYRFVDWLAAAGQTWWQVLPLGPPDRYRLAVQGALGVRGVAGAARRPARAGVALGGCSTSASARPTGSSDWERFSGRRRRSADQVRFDARVGRAAVATRADRGVRLFGDVAIYVAPGSVDHRAHPELFRDGVVAGAPPDAYSDDRAAVGQPAVRLAGDAPAALPLVGRAAAADAVAVRPRADRPLPRVRGLLGGAGRMPATAVGAAGSAGRGARVFDAAVASSGGWRWSPRTSA